jgi:succinate-semialdehyde dehydrogenase/glutarate-semialdehyde dehydrogenase
MAIATISPVAGEVLKGFEERTPVELEDKLAPAGAAAESYRLTTADLLEKDADSASELITSKMGKSYRAGQKDEVAKCMRGLRLYADRGYGFLQAVSGVAAAVGASVISHDADTASALSEGAPRSGGISAAGFVRSVDHKVIGRKEATA